MKTVTTIAELREQLSQARLAGKKIAMVPTMGNLHAGHIQLVHHARELADVVVTTIFVNPLQFGANEDLGAYPRTLQEDQRKLTEANCDLLFAPTEEEVYPTGRTNQTIVTVPGLSDNHCGASRPGHFAGVATVVAKLFGMVLPDIAVFGEKDFQQLQVIRKLTADLCLPVEIQGSPVARAENGLALSSRNGYLTEEELAIAPLLQKVLSQVAEQIKAGQRNYEQLQESAQQQLEQGGFGRDYFNIVRQDTLEAASAEDTEIVILAAARLGKARLIDNIQLFL